MRIVLASASVARARVLRGAGVAFEPVPASVDEDAVKRAARAAGATAQDAALTLAEAKAAAVAMGAPDALVIGADQILVCGADWFDKPADLVAARAHLAALRGRTHGLATAVVVHAAGAVVWRHVETPGLTMRAFSDAFLDTYLAAEGTALLGSVGAYRLEAMGAQMFERIDGDFFAVLGLPLLPLLACLRERDALPS